MGAVSIGFLSFELGPPRLPGQRGPTHEKSELLEISIVSIPSCPSCVVTGKAHRSTALVEVDELTLRSAIRAAVPSILGQVERQIEQEIAGAMNHRRGRVD
jgi:hypothetical protein